MLCWFVPSSLSGSGMCEDGFAVDDALCVLRLATIPKCQAPWTRKTVMKALRALGAVRTPVRHVPTAPMTLEYTIEHADDACGMCKA